MRKLTILALVSSLLAFTACVEDDGLEPSTDKNVDTTKSKPATATVDKKVAHAKKMADHHVKWLRDNVGIDDAQAAKLTKLFMSAKGWHERRAELKKILTASQFTKLKAAKAKHHHGKKHYKHHRWDPAKKAAWLQEKLGLTDAQKTQVIAAFKSGNWHEKRAKLEKILSKDQLDELRRLHKDKLKKHHGHHGK